MRLIPLMLAASLVPPLSLGAQSCDTLSSLTSLAPLSGRAIGTLAVVTGAPELPARMPGALAHVHVRTREATVRRQLLFAPGDTVDTLRVAESLRRLRRLRYLSEAEVRGISCAERSAVDLVVVTRDEWSTVPSVQVRSGGSEAGVTERNVLGTGRELTAGARSDAGRIGIELGAHDPWVLGGRAEARASVSTYSNGGDWWTEVGSRRRTLTDRWHTELSASGTRRTPQDPAGDLFRREKLSLLVARRLHVGATGVTELLGGVDGERASLRAAHDAAIVGPARVSREYQGITLGLARRSLSYDTLTWLLPHAAIVDVPLATEGEVVAGAGYDRAVGATALRTDMWLGRLWLPRPGSLLVGDVWASAYRVPGAPTAGTLRAALTLFLAAPGGSWAAHAFAEHLSAPDPDVRSLTSFDLASRAFPASHSLAETTAGASLERSWHVRSIGHWTIDAAALAAASTRREPPTGGEQSVFASVVGGGVHLMPNRAGRGTARLDLLVPVTAGPDGRRRPFVALSVLPWLGHPRQRDGRHIE
jgi:hypothetical protein